MNRFCNSGLQAIVQAAHMIEQEGADVVIGGGVESITMMERDNAPNPWLQEHLPALYMAMGETAEVVAKRYDVTREAQDEYALVSQQRTARAQQDGFFSGRDRADGGARAPLDRRPAQMVGEEEHVVDRDECNRADTTLDGAREAAAGLRHDERPRQRHRRQLVAALRRRVGDAGDVGRTARTRSASQPRLIFRGYAVVGCEPDEMGIGPVFAVPKLLTTASDCASRTSTCGS